MAHKNHGTAVALGYEYGGLGFGKFAKSGGREPPRLDDSMTPPDEWSTAIRLGVTAQSRDAGGADPPL